MDTNDTPLCTEEEIAQGFRNSDGKRIVDHSTSASQIFHDQFDRSSAAMMERLRDDLLESSCSCTDEEMVAQLMMTYLFPHPCDPELAYGEGGSDATTQMTTDQKRFLVGVASHMGPDWAQALYHAAVFITKVA